MSYHYTDETRENDPHALPDVEIRRQAWCQQCADYADYAEGRCGCGAFLIPTIEGRFTYRIASDPVGPFDSEAEALKQARDAAGF